jgi:hypothetical protein
LEGYVADQGTTADQASKPEHLHLVERLLALLIGVGILVWAAVIVFSPPEHSELISGCTATSTKDCVQTVSSVPETVTSTLVGAGVILLLLAVLGIRFTSIKAAGIELGATAASSTSDEAQKATTEGKAVPLAPTTVTQAAMESSTVDKQAVVSTQLQTWGLLPHEIQRAVVRRWRAEGKDGHPSTNIAQVYSPLPDYYDWYIEFIDGTTYRVTATSP